MSVIVRIRKRTWRLGAILGALVLVVSLVMFFAPRLVTKAAPPTARFTRYSVTSNTGSNVQGITLDKHSNPWFATGSGTIGTIDRATGALRTYNLTDPNAGVGYIKFDSDGQVWFQEFNANALGVLNPITGEERDFAIPTAGGVGPTFIEIDSQNNIWFNDVDFSSATGGYVGRFNPTSGVMTVWAVPTVGARLEEIGLDGEGNLWFAEQGANKVGRLNPQTNIITEYTSPTPNSSPAGILIAPDNTVWYSEHTADKIAHLFPKQARGVNTHVKPLEARPGLTTGFNHFANGLPTNAATTVQPGTAVDTTVTSSQGIIEYSLPATDGSANTEDMRFDSHGNIFFENDATAQIGELVLTGTDQPYVNVWSIPDGQGYYNIEFDTTGALWISDLAGNTVYRFVLGQ